MILSFAIMTSLLGLKIARQREGNVRFQKVYNLRLGPGGVSGHVLS
jgi:hypothetical protein